MRKSLYLFLVVCIQLASAQNFTGGFSFYLPPFDSTASLFLPEFPKEEITHFLSAGPSGAFIISNDPVRFWGVNLTTGACFPVKTKAAGIAARMRKMGINLVRFHHMDNPWTDNNGTIFLRQSGNTRDFNPATLDRLFYFITQLKKNGIYVNMNLHVSRTFLPGDGVVFADSILDFGKAVTMFDPLLISLQKEYAQKLLSTINPYTGLSLSEDPVLGMVEITNENTLYGFWKDNRLAPFSEGGGITRYHSNILDGLWNDFLLEKYGTHSVLVDAWSNHNGQVGVVNQVRNPGFETVNLGQDWTLELHDQAVASMSTDQSVSHSGNRSARVVVSQTTGTAWHVQFKQGGLSVEKDSSYHLQFAARANGSRVLNVYAMRDNDPYTWYGGTNIEVGPQWKMYTFTFTAPEDNSGQVRISIDFNNQTGTYWFDDFRFSRPVLKGLEPGESLSSMNIRRIQYAERLLYSDTRVTDMTEFYLRLQRSYYSEMYDFLKEDIGIRVPITGSNALGGPQEVHTMSGLDYIDDHAYWDHPTFPGEPWSQTNWLITNQPMLTNSFLGTVPSIFGGLALFNKPYTISEYNHAFPNRFQTEMIPVLTAYASFTGTDGFMFFQYSGDSYTDWEADRVDGFFSLHRNSAVMATFPIFAHVFREGLIQPDPDPYLIQYTANGVSSFYRNDNLGRWGKYFPYQNTGVLVRSIQTQGFDNEETFIPDVMTPGNPYLTSTGEIWVDPVLGLMNINTGDFECYAGNLLNARFVESSGVLEIEQASDRGLVGWLDLPASSDERVRRSVLVLTSRAQNRGMVWDGIRTVHNQWGNAPTEILPLQVRAVLNFNADSIKILPLDTRGQPRGEGMTYFPQARNNFSIDLNQAADRTLWYGMEIFESTTSDLASESPQIVIYPNPASKNLYVRFGRALRGKKTVKITDTFGQELLDREILDLSDESTHLRFDIDYLPAGLYFLQINSENRLFVERFVKQ
jgi:hypothetical protein